MHSTCPAIAYGSIFSDYLRVHFLLYEAGADLCNGFYDSLIRLDMAEELQSIACGDDDDT